MYLVLYIMLISFNLLNADDANNDCTPRKSININFPEIDNTYYLMLYVNETNLEGRTSCIKITFKTHENNTITEIVELIERGSSEVTTLYVTSNYSSPGIIQLRSEVNGTTITFLDYIMEFSEGESLIASVCQKNDGRIYSDRIAVFFTSRNVSPDAILAKLRSAGITGSEPNTDYFFVPQFMCPN